MPKVSVILTSYNHEDYLPSAIESVLNQSFSDFEFFICDDGSTDNSQEIIRRYNDDRINLHLREENKRARWITELLPQCKGQYIAIHHSDDIWELDKLQKQVEYLDAHPETIACFTHVQLIDENSEDFTPPPNHKYYNIFNQPNRNRYQWLRYFWDYGNALCHPSVLMQRQAFENIELLNYGLRQMPDFLRWIRTCLVGEIYVLQESLTRFRIHRISESNVSGDNLDNQIRSYVEYFLLCDDLFKISGKDAFAKVFSEYAGENIVPEFALSKIMVDKGFAPLQLYGLKKIYELLNNPETASKIKEYHNYTWIDFEEETTAIDIFSVINQFTLLNASLFIDYGAGLNEKDVLTEEVYVRQDGTFYVRYEVPEGEAISGLRFDPDEGNLWDIVLDSVIVDGVRQRAEVFNSYNKTDEYDSFVTTDPIYMISASENVNVVEISGRIRPLSLDVLTLIVNERLSLTQHNESLTQHNESLTQHNESLTQHNNVLVHQNSEMAKCNEVVARDNKELESKIADMYNSKTWKIGNRIVRMLRLFVPKSKK